MPDNAVQPDPTAALEVRVAELERRLAELERAVWAGRDSHRAGGKVYH